MLSPELKYPGTTIVLTNAFTDDNGFLFDPETVSLELIDPYGSTQSYTYPTTVLRDSTGQYHADVVPNMGGVWFYRWAVSSGTSKLAMEGDFVVQTSPFIEGRRDAYRC